MIITDVRYYPYRVPFRRPFTTAHGTLLAREGVIVELVTDEGMLGYGDMAAVTEFGAPDVATLLRAARTIELRIKGMYYKEIRYSDGTWLDQFPSPLLFAVEKACDSIFSQIFWRNYRYRPPPYHPRYVPVNTTIGTVEISDACEAAQKAVEAGFTCIKLKVGILDSAADEIKRVQAVRATIGDNINLRIDANEAWLYDQAIDILTALQTCHLQFIEQPLPREDIDGMRRLRQAITIPIAADESLTDRASVQHILENDAADVLILKPQLLGGRYATDLVMRERRKKSIVITSVLESGIGVSQTLSDTSFFLLRAQASPILECGLATLPLLEDDLILEALPIEHGNMRIPQKGTKLDWEALARYRLEVDGL